MKPGIAPAQALPARPQLPEGRELAFPERSSVARLRALRQELFKRGKIQAALEVAERLMELAPGRESAWRLGFLQREAGRYRESIRTFRDALRYRKGPAYVIPEIHLHAAASWSRLNDYKRMGECLRRAYRARPKARSDFNLHLCFGNYFTVKKRYTEAKEELERARDAATNPHQRGKALSGLGVVAYYRGDLAEAGLRMDEAIQVHKRAGHRQELAFARYLRGVFHFSEGQFGLARAILVRAAEAFQRTGVKEKEACSWGDAGNAAVMQEDWEGAKPLLDRAASLAKSCQFLTLTVVVHALRAQVMARLGDFEQASTDLAAAKSALKGSRNYVGSAHIYRAQARIAELFGDWTGMRLWARRAERYAVRENDRPRIAEFRAMRARAEQALGRRRAAFHARKTAGWVADLVGRGSKRMQEVRHDALRLAAGTLPILISGESGTGKTALAREIHASGSRAKGPCVVVPCEGLVFAASDLNGHAEGAWSGASRKAAGLVGKAAGGTLILDRVDELDPRAQRVLIPVVEGRLRAVGSEVEEKVDVRIVAVCSRPERLIPDLRRRLEGARIEVPPLRERAEDVPALVRSMLGDRVRITEDALAFLARLPWEGNLAELKSFLDRVVSAVAGSIGIQTVQAALPKRPGRRVRRARALAGMAAALSR